MTAREPPKLAQTACPRAGRSSRPRELHAVLWQREIRVLPGDEKNGGGELGNNCRADEPDQARILAHERLGANEDCDMNRRRRGNGCHEHSHRSAPGRRAKVQDETDREKRMAEGKRRESKPLGSLAHPFSIGAWIHPRRRWLLAKKLGNR